MDPELQKILAGRHHDPFDVLGHHRHGEQELVRVYLPGITRLEIEERHPMQRLGDSDFFEWRGPAGTLPPRYLLSWTDAEGGYYRMHDPYCFPPQVDPTDLQLFRAGSHYHAWQFLGAHPRRVDGIAGVLFAVWAPNAERVSVVGDFNLWDGRRHPMRNLGESGVWELFLPDLDEGALYKFEIRSRPTGELHLKSDPFARRCELRPATAALVTGPGRHTWQDDDWLRARRGWDWLHSPISIYELHLGSWQRAADGGFLDYRTLADRLVPYVRSLGFSHIELLPVMEHPHDDSWGYQVTGFFAPTSRYGTPDDLRYFIDSCHRNEIGVILDWVPAHFPRDAHALANFDGTALYEYPDPARAAHRDWGTLIFNYERHEVRSFLISSACYWLEEFHADGLRVDAVASMLYLNFSRQAEAGLVNRYGGTHNLEAIECIRELNTVTHERYPGTLTMAEESTDWPLVSRPVSGGGLGFSLKWNMGWMHDTLEYLGEDPLFRQHHHEKLTFGLMYAFSENFVLPFSHDEVVHLKRSLLGKMPGDEWQQFATLRLLYAYMWTFPGKKLLFMGGEFAQRREWDHRATLEWHLAYQPAHAGVRTLLQDLNVLYRATPALHRYEFEPQGFEWIDCDDKLHSVISYLRRDGDSFVVVVLNFTPIVRHGYRIGVPSGGSYRTILNSDAARYGGSDVGRAVLEARAEPCMNRPCALDLTLPPLAALILRPG